MTGAPNRGDRTAQRLRLADGRVVGVASAIPDCRARFLPGEGHMWFFPRWREILGVLVAA